MSQKKVFVEPQLQEELSLASGTLMLALTSGQQP